MKLLILSLVILIHVFSTEGQIPSELKAITYNIQGDLKRFYGVSLRLEGLKTRDNSGRHAWEIDTLKSCRISSIRFPPGSQSYLLAEGEGDSLLTLCLTELNASSSRTHPPQFSNAHLSLPNVIRFSLGNEPPIHGDDFAPYGGYVSWANEMLIHADREKTYFQTAQAITILNTTNAKQHAVWNSAKAAWAEGLLDCRGIATTEKCHNVNAKIINTLRADLNKYDQDFPGAKIYFTEWNTSRDELATAENDYLQLAVAEMLLACARLYYERNGHLEALDYHGAWNQQSQGNLLNLVSGEWVLGKAGEVYRDFAPLFYGQWGDYTNTDPSIIIESFIAEDGRYAVAYVNKNNFSVTPGLGFTADPRSYGVVYFDSISVDIKKKQINETVVIYPNPGNSKFIISLNDQPLNSLKSNVICGIYSLSGQLCKTFYPESERFTIDMSDFSDGVYIIKVIADNVTVTKRIVKN